MLDNVFSYMLTMFSVYVDHFLDDVYNDLKKCFTSVFDDVCLYLVLQLVWTMCCPFFDDVY
jgi:hypothetical protein